MTLDLSEKDVLRATDSLIEQLGGQIVRLEQRRASHICEGLPDRRYRLNGVAFWFEGKAPKGQLTRGQYDFLRAEHRCGELVAAGGLYDVQQLAQIVGGLRDVSMRAWGWASVEWIAQRGFRGEPRPKRPTQTTLRSL